MALGLVAVLGGEARAATLKNRARLREGPTAASALLGELDPGTTVDILGDSAGWKRVRTPDGRGGFVWGEHLAEADGEATLVAAETKRPEPSGPRSLADEVRDLRADVSALRQRPEPATAADVERVRTELDRLTNAQRDLARRLDDRLLAGGAPGDPPPESSFGLTPLVFLVGGVLGWAASRVVQRRRDRRQRHRLRF